MCLEFAAPPLLHALSNGCWQQEGCTSTPASPQVLRASPPSPSAPLDCGDLLSRAAGRDQSLRRDTHSTGSPCLPGDCHRQTHPGQERALKGADPLRACLLQDGAFYLSDLLHTTSVISCCPHGLHPCPIPITGVAATSCLNVAVGAGCSSGKDSASLKNPFFAERCPQTYWRCHLLLAHRQDPRALPSRGLWTAGHGWAGGLPAPGRPSMHLHQPFFLLLENIRH